MCGIAGAVATPERSAQSWVESMSGALRHRGPDGDGLWQTETGGRRVVFGHRRLAILDLSERGRQPMRDPLTEAVVTYNGEIYNFRELRRELGDRGHVFRSDTDTEVLLRAYAEWGSACLTRLRGMFAFALWDPRRRVVLLARDPRGIKPLYYWRSAAGDVLFASEVRALLASGRVERRIDAVARASYVWNGFVVGPPTLVSGVRSFESGTFAEIEVDSTAWRQHRYWHAPSERALIAPAPREELRECLAGAVRGCLESDVPLAVFLSGGIDSSTVTALAQAQAQRPVVTVNVGFDENGYDESGYARAVAEAIGTEHHDLRLTQERFRDALPSALGALDQPTFDGLNSYFASRLVRDLGIKVALTGTGGDELFGGYDSFPRLGAVRQGARLAGVLPESLVRGALGLMTQPFWTRPSAIPPQTGHAKLADAVTSNGDLVAIYQTAYALFTQRFYSELLLGSSTEGVTWGLPEDVGDRLRREIAGQPVLYATSQLEQALFLGERLLRDLDTASMAVSVEGRVPLVDHVVVEEVSRLPVSVRFPRPVQRKQLLRDAGLLGLDPQLFERPAHGFEMPLELWCQQALRDEVRELFEDTALVASVGLHPPAVSRLLAAFESRAPGLYWSRLWAIFVFLWWCREHRMAA